ncbi:hypothetical protein FA15DRAFT_662644 [Coprinopsis marcescibilis]|uniref:F-box domain-containing protein n=1 Tax=Coprinopsis marcescibilis TaxID=230819 RepID=A0A5C3LDA2_COPMA|nr:hypothetical protein FA15DRAFT_662644 [Coprinopsis marcescibilis]
MSKASRPSFIDDLVPLILESTEHWWTRDYARLAQVSPAWAYYVQKRLYFCPTLYSFDACASLARSLLQQPSLKHLMNGIELRPTHEEGRGRLTDEHFESIRALLALPGLRRVVIGGQLAMKAERFLNALAYPETITELVVDGGSIASSIPLSSLELDECLFYRFPSLRTLKLANLQELEIVMPPPSQFTIPISNLIINNVAITGGYLCSILDSSSLDFLSISAKSAAEYDEELRLILGCCRVNMLHYAVETSSHSPGRSFLDVDGVDTLSLQKLQLDGLSIDPGLFLDLQRRCPSLKELGVSGRSVGISPREWATFAASRTLPCLTKLKLPGGTNNPPYAKWKADDFHVLQSICISHEVQLA